MYTAVGDSFRRVGACRVSRASDLRRQGFGGRETERASHVGQVKFALVINLITAKALGLDCADHARGDRMIILQCVNCWGNLPLWVMNRHAD
jgi:hypothetical protein